MMDGSESPDARVEILESLGIDVSQVDLADSDAAIDALWDGTMRQIAAQLRFMGRLAGIDDSGAFNADAPEVVETREMVVEALRDFFVLDAREAYRELDAQAAEQREAMLERYPEQARSSIDYLDPGAAGLPQIEGVSEDGHINGAGVEHVDGLIEQPPPPDLLGLVDHETTFAEWEAASAERDAFLQDLRQYALTLQERERMDLAAFEQQIANIIDLFVSAWEALKTEYERITALIVEGRYMFAVNYVGSVAAQALPGAILTFVALALVGAAGGGVVLAVSRNVFQVVVRQAITIAPSQRQLRNAAAGAIMSVTITRMRRSAMPGGFEDAGQIGRTADIDTNNLPPEEARMVRTTEGTIGSTEADAPLDDSLPGDRRSGRDREDEWADGSYRDPNDPEGVRRASDGEAMVQEDGQWRRISETRNGTKGKFGEMMADDYAANQTPPWEKLNGDPATMDTPGHQGIDGVYRDPGPPPRVIVADAKYGSAGLGALVDGTRQMSPKWVRDRLEDAVGEDAAFDIGDNYEPVVMKIDKDGNVTEHPLKEYPWRDEDR